MFCPYCGGGGGCITSSVKRLELHIKKGLILLYENYIR